LISGINFYGALMQE